MSSINKRGIYNAYKICILVALFVYIYVLLFHCTREIGFQRFEGIFVSYINLVLNGHTDWIYNPFPFSTQPLLYIDQSLPQRVQGVVGTQTYWPNLVSLYLILHQVTGIQPYQLMLSPLLMIIIPICYFLVVREYIQNHEFNHIIISLFTVYIVLGLAKSSSPMYVWQPALIITLIILFAFNRVFRAAPKKKIYSCIVVFLLFSLACYWHSAHFKIFFFIASTLIVSIIAYIYYSFRQGSMLGYAQNFRSIVSSNALFYVASIIVTIVFSQQWRSGYISVVYENVDLFEVINLFFKKTRGELAFPVPYAYNYKEYFWGEVYFDSYIVVLIGSMLIFAIPLIYSYLLKEEKYKYNILTGRIFCYSIILSQIIFIVLYYNTKAIDLGYVPFFFPLMGLCLYSSIKMKPSKLSNIIQKVIILLLIVLIVSSCIGIVSLNASNDAGKASLTTYSDTQNSFEWYYKAHDPNRSTIVDFNILGKYLQREAYKQDLKIQYVDLSPSHVQSLIESEQKAIPNIDGSYVIIDYYSLKNNVPIHTTYSRSMLLFPEDQLDIGTGIKKQKIYQDNRISTYLLGGW